MLINTTDTTIFPIFLIESERGTEEEEKSKDQGRVLVEAVLAKVRQVRARRRCLAISSEARSEPLALLSLYFNGVYDVDGQLNSSI
ncbi:hypothetical protein Sjap_022648 [Stephania japonica]|uniref:Uncharacterized protein n=1 Tax=Stephania japonica TaxID=461633 RepID=A0AAP0EPS7_9MAGN